MLSTQAVGSAVKILLGSIFVGSAMAFASAYLLKHRGLFRRPDLFFQTEIMVVVLFPYIAWMLAEAAHLSGIVSILFCGIVMAHYTTHNLHPWVSQYEENTHLTILVFIALRRDDDSLSLHKQMCLTGCVWLWCVQGFASFLAQVF